jgi:lysozyme
LPYRNKDHQGLKMPKTVKTAIAGPTPKLPWDGTVPLAATSVVKRIEGYYGTPYDDNGAKPGGTWTIGYGTIIDAQGKPVSALTPPITESEAEALLMRDMQGAANEVKLRVKVPLAEYEAAALISWTYNLGGGNLAKSTMLIRINAGQKSDVPEEMRKWIYQEGKPLVGLLRRRWAEAAIFIGIDATNACVRAWKEINSLDDWPSF